MTATIDADLASPLAVIANELAASGYSVHEPGGVRFINARGAICDLSIGASGLVTWEYRSCEGRYVNPVQLAGVVFDILGPSGAPRVRRLAGASLTSAVGLAAALHGLQARHRVIDNDTRRQETCSILTITNPARPERGTIRVTDDGAVYRHCQIQPADHALTYVDIAAAITRALVAAGHAPSDLP